MPPGRSKSGKTTMQDIADQMGISKVSVSKALRGQRGVSEELRQKIFSTAQRMGYGRVSSQAAYRFAFVVSKHFFLETDAFYSEMYYYFNKECLAKGYDTTLMIVNGADEERGLLPSHLQKEPFDGIAVAGEISDAYLELLGGLKYPMALIDFESHRLDFHSILTDNYYWGFRAAQYLINHGHKKIGFVGQPGATNSITDRYLGYRKALLIHALPWKEEWIIVNNDARSGLYRSDIALPADMPSAFVCHCDMAAHYLLSALAMRDIRCPRDVSVVSFDNTKLAQLNQPPLTSVNIDIRAFARQALAALCAAIQEGGRPADARIYMPAMLVERDSVAFAGLPRE